MLNYNGISMNNHVVFSKTQEARILYQWCCSACFSTTFRSFTDFPTASCLSQEENLQELACFIFFSIFIANWNMEGLSKIKDESPSIHKFNPGSKFKKGSPNSLQLIFIQSDLSVYSVTVKSPYFRLVNWP